MKNYILFLNKYFFFIKQIFLMIYSVYRYFNTFKYYVFGFRKPKMDNSSIVFFTTNKCASMFQQKFMTILENDNDFIHIDFDGFFSLNQKNKIKEFTESDLLTNKGFIYGPFRSYRLNDWANYKMIIILRDPRDVLISNYFSIKFSHKLVSPDMVNKRISYSNMDINEFVLMRAHQKFIKIYNDYVNYMKSSQDYLFIRYEDMIDNGEWFIQRVTNYLGLKLSRENQEIIISELSTNDNIENIKKHKRSGKSGQYRQKLDDETISKLNSLFASSLDYLGYDCE